MKITVDKKFLKDLKKLRKNPQVVRRVDAKVAEVGLIIADVVTIEGAIEVIPSILKMKGYDFHYRIRVGDYRLGVFLTPK